VLSVLDSEDDEKYITGINLWEISLKYSLGKLELDGLNPEILAETAIEAGFHILDPDYKTFSSYYKLPKKDDHKDPFDRLLIWYALNNELVLITRDKRIEHYIEDGLRVMIGT
jgi:PIN domain nuclease of toxin-antitoxin system